MKILIAIIKLLAVVLPVIFKYLEKRAAKLSPEEKADEEIAKVKTAIVNGDTVILNAAFERLREADRKRHARNG